MEPRWFELGGSAWTVRADSSAASWPDVPDALRQTLAAGIPATVPGCVHTDLLAAGLIEDPYFGANETVTDWIGRQRWIYRREFILGLGDPELEARACDLECDGLDTVAEIFVNGVSVGTSVNMHRRSVFPVRPRLVLGRNLIEVVFDSAFDHIAAMSALVGDRVHVERDDYNLIRKMACNFGWDWGPRLVTCGIWKRIGLRSWSHARIGDVSVLATAKQKADGTWVGRLDVTAQLTGNLRFSALTVRVHGDGVSGELGVPVEEDWTQASLELTGVQPWWPHSLGEQPLYDVEIVFHNDTTVLDRVTRRTGFRSTELDTTPDADGKGANFALRINGTEVFARGANWIPDDCFVTRVTPERYRERIQQAKDANVDLLRVWGGGLYETEDFYAACDELGMMVWQDFALACAAYPEEEPFASEFDAEARDNVMRLSQHPSLVIWNGNNEILWGHDEWDWSSQPNGDRTWGEKYFYETFPAIVAELDPSRPYWHGSPSSGSKDIRPNDPNYGCMHIWDVWNQRDYLGYDDYSPRFVSEFGYQGPATWATWQRALDPSDLRADSPVMLAHQKASGGNGKLDSGIAPHLPAPGETAADFDDWLYLMQLQQARAVRYGIERWRSLRGRCHGSIVWQINDCWPVVSWAALDLGTNAAGAPVARRKPLWFAMRDAYADHLLTIQTADGAPRLVLVNDAGADWTAGGTIELRRFSGEVVSSARYEVLVPARSKADVAIDFELPVERAGLALVATGTGAARAVKVLAEDIVAGLPAASVRASVTAAPDGAVVTVTADTFVRSLAIFPDRVSEDSYPDSLLVDLFPGETHSFQVTGNFDEGSLEALTAPPVLRFVTVEKQPAGVW
jgi:beta-mannosidase